MRDYPLWVRKERRPQLCSCCNRGSNSGDWRNTKAAVGAERTASVGFEQC